MNIYIFVVFNAINPTLRKKTTSESNVNMHLVSINMIITKQFTAILIHEQNII